MIEVQIEKLAIVCVAVQAFKPFAADILDFYLPKKIKSKKKSKTYKMSLNITVRCFVGCNLT